MKPVERFAFAPWLGTVQSQPSESAVLVDGQPSTLTISGRRLCRQYETPAGYVLITELDFWVEEQVFVVLISKDLRTVLGEHVLGHWYSSYYLKEVEWLDETHFFVTLEGLEEYRFYFTLRPRHIPLIYPRLGVACQRLDTRRGTWKRQFF
ncbi:hypothetical protein [Pseudomonas purpurea]|uniref:hypothetical protein n=1 Tax=Pseudomonas purpurea TaxID=3136737 RepID=UPI003265C4DC